MEPGARRDDEAGTPGPRATGPVTPGDLEPGYRLAWSRWAARLELARFWRPTYALAGAGIVLIVVGQLVDPGGAITRLGRSALLLALAAVTGIAVVALRSNVRAARRLRGRESGDVDPTLVALRGGCLMWALSAFAVLLVAAAVATALGLAG